MGPSWEANFRRMPSGMHEPVRRLRTCNGDERNAPTTAFHGERLVQRKLHSLRSRSSDLLGDLREDIFFRNLGSRWGYLYGIVRCLVCASAEL